MAVNTNHCLLLAVVCIVCYYNSLQCGFVFDDISAIKDNRDLRPHTPIKNIFFNDFWGTPMEKVRFVYLLKIHGLLLYYSFFKQNFYCIYSILLGTKSQVI